MKTYYSKKILGGFLKTKNFMFSENKNLLNDALKINKLYLKQKQRNYCKNCESKISKKKYFKSFGVKYFCCKICDHVNGEREDSDIFVKKLYINDKKFIYGKKYLKDFDDKVKNIYLPKVNFIKKHVKNLKILDLGAGAGHFLKACEKKKIKGIGYDTSKELVNFSKKQLTKNKVYLSDLSDIENIILNSDANCITLISVLEHLQKPNEFFKIFKKSNIKYLFFSIPLFSLTAIIENAFQNIYPRNLFGPHTHMYTKKSIYYILKKYNFKIVAEWWFGSDFLDLSRVIKLTMSSSSNLMSKKFDSYFFKHIDKLQSILDKNKNSSDLQILITKK